MIDKFFSWEVVLLGLAVFSIVLLTRRIVEGLYSPIKGNHWWKVFLSIYPALAGIAIAFTDAMPIPKEMEGSSLLYGLVVGMFSGVVYRIVKATIKKKYPNAFSTKDAE